MPFFWQQSGIQAKLQIHQTDKTNQESLQKHMSNLLKDYKYVSIVNLLSEKKKDEKKLSNYLKDLLSNCQEPLSQKIYYDHIDFHDVVKETDFSNINQMVNKIVDKNDFTVLMHNLIDDTYDTL